MVPARAANGPAVRRDDDNKLDVVNAAAAWLELRIARDASTGLKLPAADENEPITAPSPAPLSSTPVPGSARTASLEGARRNVRRALPAIARGTAVDAVRAKLPLASDM